MGKFRIGKEVDQEYWKIIPIFFFFFEIDPIPRGCLHCFVWYLERPCLSRQVTRKLTGQTRRVE
jgi:hypothetical protein